MPRGLILVALLLLTGAYFFLSGGAPAQRALPSLDVRADAAPSERGYIVTVTGSIRLPGEEEYEVNGVVITFYGDGEKVHEETLDGGTVKGPGEYPISASATLPPTATSGRIAVRGTVIHGGYADEISASVPVVLPSKGMRVRPPQIFVSVGSLTPLDENVSVVLSVTVHNPNEEEMIISDAKISLNGQERALSIPAVAGRKSASATAGYILPNAAKEYRVTVAGRYTVSDTSREFSYTGSMYIPSVPLARPYASVSATPLSASGSGIEFSLSGTVFNPNPSALMIDRVYVRVIRGNITQEFGWVEKNTVPPRGSLALPSKTITVDEDLHRARVEVHVVHGGSDDVVASFPLFTVDISDVLEAPEIRTALSYDSNAERCTVTVSIENPNGVSIDVNNLRVRFEHGETSDERTFPAFSVSPGATEGRSFTPDLGVSPGADSLVSVSGEYGISALGAWIPFRYGVAGKCA